MKHTLVIRMKFKDKDLFKKYLEISKDVLIPSLKSQTNKKFILCFIIYDEDVDYVKKYLNLDFKNFSSLDKFFNYVKDEEINIQTRHDMDDYMSPDYIDIIQSEYLKNIEKYDKFLIQSQPIRLDYHTNIEYKMNQYTETRNSMFLSLCQKNITNSIFDQKHGQMYEVTKNIITLPEGYTKWVIHGDNISVRKNILK